MGMENLSFQACIAACHAKGQPATEAAAMALALHGAQPAAHFVAGMHTVYVLDLLETAALLKRMGYDLTGVVAGLAAVSPRPSALDVARAVRDPTLFPQATRAEVGAALRAAGHTGEDVTAALAAVFPATLRCMGPAGKLTGTHFDDRDAALSLGPITALLVHAGDILDGLQVTHGAVPLPLHGGTRGGPNPVPLPQGITLVGISGYTGQWYGGEYVLQLWLHTSDGLERGPFGTMDGHTSRTHFSFLAKDGEQIVAFTGSYAPGLEADRTTTNYVTSLGAVFKS